MLFAAFKSGEAAERHTMCRIVSEPMVLLGILAVIVGIFAIAWPPLVVPLSDLVARSADQAKLETDLRRLVDGYRRTLGTDRRYLLEQFEFADMARKVVGVGSVGTRCWIVLMLGRDTSDPLSLSGSKADAAGSLRWQLGGLEC